MPQTGGYEFKKVGFERFVWLCFRDLFSESWSRADTITSLVGALAGVVIHFVPSVEASVTKSLWIIPLIAFAAISAFRLLMSPFWVYKEHKDSLLEELEKSEGKLLTLSGRLERKLSILPEVHEQPLGIGRTTYFIDVFNESEATTIFGVMVTVSDMSPKLVKWSIPLHLKHDNPGHKREFVLNPRGKQEIDLVTGAGQQLFQIVDVIGDADGGRNWTRVFWKDVPSRISTLTVQVTGNDTVSSERQFYVWFDEAFKLRCSSSRPQLAPCIPDAQSAGV